jgi:beta-galactosidase
MIAARDAPASAIDRDAGPADRLFSTFAYTGEGEGGDESPLATGILAYTDDAFLYLDTLPECLAAARLIRTANVDRGYWANDYIVATAGRDLELFVAHDAVAPRPEWLGEFRDTGGIVKVNGRPFTVFTRTVASGDVVRIPGNVDQARQPGRAHNLIIFAREVSATGPRP